MASSTDQIYTVSETIGEYSSPPEYSDSLIGLQTSSSDDMPIINRVLFSCGQLDKSDFPPSYEFLYNKKSYYVTYCLESSCSLFKKIFNKKFSLILLAIVSLALQVANIYVGQAYRDNCPIEPSIPIWLTVYSIGIVFLIIDLIILVKLELRRNFFIFVLLIALLLFWFIKGAVSYNKDSIYYCDAFCYGVAFWNLTAHCFLIAVLILVLLFTQISRFIHSVACSGCSMNRATNPS